MKKYGNLTIISDEKDEKHKVLCQCDCGNTKKINIYKDYSPENCQWITRSENSRKAAVERWSKSS